MKGSWQRWLPIAFVLLAAATRWPGVFPPNFSAFYGLAFCAGAFFPGRVAWWVPLGTLAVTDVALNAYYSWALGINAFQWYQLVNYAGFAGLVLLGRGFGARLAWWALVGGGLFGACLFYLVTNTTAWLLNPFHNPEYTRDLAGWLVALTKGTAGHPPTWQFFWNTLASGGLFTGLFAGVWQWARGTVREPEAAAPKEPAGEESDAEPENAKA